MWTDPKTDWAVGDEPTEIDLNKIGNNLVYLASKVVPAGIIAMWSGTLATIPAGWALCDGQNGTPDLRDRFILGAGIAEEPGAVGGSHTKTLIVANLPGHTHSFTTGNQSASHTHSGTTGNQGASHSHTVTGGSHRHTYDRTTASTMGLAAYPGTEVTVVASINNSSAYTNYVSHTHTVGNQSASHNHTFTTGTQSDNHNHSGTTDATGSGAAFDIRPRYYKLAFIIKI